jgi:hypothetical protein
MQSSGNSEFSSSGNERYSMTFWLTFLLTLSGATGLISMVVDGPRWITYPSFIIAIIVLIPLASSSMKNK